MDVAISKWGEYTNEIDFIETRNRDIFTDFSDGTLYEVSDRAWITNSFLLKLGLIRNNIHLSSVRVLLLN